jgi:hypothetical protein
LLKEVNELVKTADIQLKEIEEVPLDVTFCEWAPQEDNEF